LNAYPESPRIGVERSDSTALSATLIASVRGTFSNVAECLSKRRWTPLPRSQAEVAAHFGVDPTWCRGRPDAVPQAYGRGTRKK